MPAGDGRAKTETQMVGERRQLTVLFCDLVNYTGLTESLDSEDVAELIIAYQESGKRIFTKYGGYIAQFLGDGLLVYFGFPEAHEDDAVRSVAAALELLAELDHIRQTHAPGAEELRLEARVGIHTGAAVVGVSAGTERSVIFGETVNIAARLQSMAEPGSVLISEPTQALLRGGFEYESRCLIVIDRAKPVALCGQHATALGGGIGARSIAVRDPEPLPMPGVGAIVRIDPACDQETFGNHRTAFLSRRKQLQEFGREFIIVQPLISAFWTEVKGHLPAALN